MEESSKQDERNTESIYFYPPLWRQRRTFAFRAIKDSRTTEVADFGCGEGSLLEVLLNSCQFSRLIGVDIDIDALSIAKSNCKPRDDDYKFLRELPLRLNLFHG